MLIKKPNDIPSSEVTSKDAYLNRRKFLERAGLMVASVATTGVVYHLLNRRSGAPLAHGEKLAADDSLTAPVDPIASGFITKEAKTPFEDVAGYNNFYEFSTDKYDVAQEAAKFDTRGWVVSVEGLVSKPRKFDLDDLKKIAPLEERIYRHRCVEAWSMVIPWLGFPIASLLKQVEPLSSAKYIRFETLLDPTRMPNQRGKVLDWPYVEGLRMDEAMHPLAILAVGVFGETLLPQNGPPLRLVAPW
jgi:sulfoxide reductase catalytic subunit YedY